MPIYKNKRGPGYIVRINYTDEYGRKKQLTRSNENTKTLSGAKLYEAKLLTEMQIKPKEIENENMTFNQLYANYKEFIFTERRNTTIRQTESVYKLYMADFFGKRKIFEITVNDVLKWKNKIKNEHPEFKISYLNTLYKNLSKIFNFAVEYYNLNVNPAKKAKAFVDPNNFDIDELENEDCNKYWKLEDFMKFYNTVAKEIELESDFQKKLWKSNFLTFFTISFFIGTRKGEAFALTWNRIKKKNGIYQLYIRKSLNQDSKKIIITDPKNKSSIRYVPICDFLLKQLNKHRELYEQVYLFNDDWFLCGGFQPLKRTTCATFKNNYERLLSLPHIKIHGLRHSFATLLINGNINIKTISQLMGHSTVQETWNRYGHLYPEATNEAIVYINSINELK